MPPKLVTLVRHGQAEHNVDERYYLRDPYLTPLGEQQCMTLPARFPQEPAVDLLVTSPLKRTIQTTILGFPDPIAAGVPVLALAELQETSEMPCDTGSDVSILQADPMLKATSKGAKVHVDFSRIPPDWPSKTGFWSPEPDALRERARAVRKWLAERDEDHVVCVLHGGFLHYLTEDWTGSHDLPGTGWQNTEFRNYVFDPLEQLNLKETEESKARRVAAPLGKTEMRQFMESHTKN
ncbi:histidine phosphatase superfamily [Sphaerosporella brunnea]|uniref:Histidine phosphatase superfamily n=1 Tax=Sphaerosporella brunnea TaxID=1250544 RepID=A0A5J5F1N9_9PEZI|nr:histidine phosphatase superfamily [Sphaerosporella brunnea]